MPGKSRAAAWFRPGGSAGAPLAVPPAAKNPAITSVPGWLQMLSGIGRTFWPDPGNAGNAPSPSLPVQTGSYEFIIPQMFSNQAIVNVPVVPPAFRDWNQYAVNEYGLSGLEGGGATGLVPSISNGPIEYYDDSTGLYISLGDN